MCVCVCGGGGGGGGGKKASNNHGDGQPAIWGLFFGTGGGFLLSEVPVSVATFVGCGCSYGSGLLEWGWRLGIGGGGMFGFGNIGGSGL